MHSHREKQIVNRGPVRNGDLGLEQKDLAGNMLAGANKKKYWEYEK